MNMKKAKFSIWVLVLAIASLGVAGAAGAAPLGITGMDISANVISVQAQDASNGKVLVGSVTAAQDGWLLIRKDANGAPGTVIGFAPVHQGLNTNIGVAIRTTNLTSTLWATLVGDPFATTPLAVPASTIGQEDSLVSVAFDGAAQLPTTSGISTSKITVHAQDTTNGQVSVDSVTAAQAGWLLIRKDEFGMPGAVLGFAPVNTGLNNNIIVDIKTVGRNGVADVTPTLWATLAADPTALIPFTSPPSTVTQEGSLAAVTFGSAALAGGVQIPTTGGAPAANKITVRAQDASGGKVFVDSVTAAQDGWLLIRKDANGIPGSVLGFAPVHQGSNTDVSVAIRTTNASGADILTAMLWATLVEDPNASTPYATPGVTVQQDSGAAAAVAFSSTP
jgi:hypothetical protein